MMKRITALIASFLVVCTAGHSQSLNAVIECHEASFDVASPSSATYNVHVRVNILDAEASDIGEAYIYTDDFRSLTAFSAKIESGGKTIKKYKVKELGKETVAGKECTKYEVTVFMMGQPQKQTVWVYKGITLKSASSSDFGDMVQTATKIQENVEIPASMFVLPAGVKVQEMDMGMMGGGW